MVFSGELSLNIKLANKPLNNSICLATWQGLIAQLWDNIFSGTFNEKSCCCSTQPQPTDLDTVIYADSYSSHKLPTKQSISSPLTLFHMNMPMHQWKLSVLLRLTTGQQLCCVSVHFLSLGNEFSLAVFVFTFFYVHTHLMTLGNSSSFAFYFLSSRHALQINNWHLMIIE